MDPVTLIVTALAAGATKGLTDAAAAAIGDTYRQLKAAIKNRLAKHPRAESTLEDFLDDPTTYEKPMIKQISDAKLDTDEEVLHLAKTVLESADPAGAKIGKYNIDMRHVRNAQIGDNNTQHNA
jgi:hypothetical protein